MFFERSDSLEVSIIALHLRPGLFIHRNMFELWMFSMKISPSAAYLQSFNDFFNFFRCWSWLKHQTCCTWSLLICGMLLSFTRSNSSQFKPSKDFLTPFQVYRALHWLPSRSFVMTSYRLSWFDDVIRSLSTAVVDGCSFFLLYFEVYLIHCKETSLLMPHTSGILSLIRRFPNFLGILFRDLIFHRLFMKMKKV